MEKVAQKQHIRTFLISLSLDVIAKKIKCCYNVNWNIISKGGIYYMKGLKKLSILGLGLALTASLAACSNSSSLTNELNAVPEAQQEVYPEVTFDENYEKEDLRLS